MSVQGQRRWNGSENWAAYAAATWAFAFSAMSFYWAMGGMAASRTLAHSIQEKADRGETSFVALLWATGCLKLLAGLLALALAPRWKTAIHRKLLLLAGWAAGGFMAIYGLAGTTQALLMELDLTDIPESFGADVVRWYLFFWEPFWLLGGILFILATWQKRKALASP